MNYQEEYIDFIGIYRNVFTQKSTNDLISYFDKLEKDKHSAVWISDTQYGGGCNRLDTAVALEQVSRKWYDIVNESVYECLRKYRKKYFSMDSMDNLRLTSPFIKVQKTYPQGGYHIWHYEVDGIDNIARSLAWILYLNDVPEGEGETEFLFQGLRIQPKQGTLIMWPAQFTHTHRGNPVYNCVKYIATGWIEYADVHEGIGPWRIDEETGYCYYMDNPPFEDEDEDTCEDDDDDVICDMNKPKRYKRLSDLT